MVSLKPLVNGVPPQIRNDVKMAKNRLRQSFGHFNEAMQVVDNEPPASHGCARGDLNPLSGFYFPLFSMVFPWGISIRVETCGSGRKQKCGILWRLYTQSLHVF
jgi:hypothetical protein